MSKKQIKSGGARKYGRNKISCANYRSMQQRERNKGKRLLRHLKRYSMAMADTCAIAALKKLPQAFQK